MGIDKYILKPVVLKDLLHILDEQAREIQSGRDENSGSGLENKKQLENDIKSAIATFLKSGTGKGPRDVSVFISDNQIEVVAVEVLTTYEKSVLDNVQNIVIIKNIREAFFSAKEKDVCNRISSVIGKDVRLQDMFINVEKDRNKLVFTIV